MPSRIDNHTLSQLISDHPRAVDGASLSPSDWPLLLQAAHQEGVGPLLYWRLSKSGELVSLPTEARNSLRGMYARTWAQNQKIFEELSVITRLFHEKGIPVVVLKGACFALTIYPDIGLRPMGDLDVLVPASKLAEAVEIAESLGYADTIPEASPGLHDLLSHHACLQKSGSGSITLEIHNSLVADKTFAYAVPVDWFWEQTEPLNGSSKNRFENLLVLTPTAQLLYAASHAMLQHGGDKAPLRWYYDLDQLIRSSGSRLDWDLLLEQAQKFAWSSALKAALAQTQDYFGTPVPDTVRIRLSRQTDHHESLVKKKQSQPGTKILLENQTLASLNWHGRARLVLALLFPSPAYMRWRYRLKSSWSLPVYYPFRWWGIARDALATVIELLKRQSVPRT
ncbi:MAG: nucleotidyltransferase family protein [Anaerolineales bacterium]|nr:nucleotidyltransferase family protein [Anaerolineales bacterium]